MASDYLFDIFKLFLSFFCWPLCCLSFFHLWLLITSDIFKLFLSFLFWPLCCLSFHLWLLITSLTSSTFSCPFYFGHCVVCPSIYGFWLPLTSSNFSCPFYFGHCVVCPSIYGFWLPLWHLQPFLVLFILAIVLSVLPPSMASDYLFDIFKLFLSFFCWPLCCLSFFHLWLLITSDIFKLFLSFLFWPLCCLSFHLWLLITSLVSSNFSCPFSFGHCVVCPSSIYGFWLPLWYLQTFLVLFLLAIVLSVLLPSMASDYLFDIFKLFLSFLFWPLCCLSFHLWLLITSLISSNFSCPFYFGYCVVCPSSIYGFWLPLWYLQSFLVLFILAIVLSVLLPSMASDYLFGIFKQFLSFFCWPLCFLSFHLWLLITSLISSNFSCPFSVGHCVFCPSSIYGFWLPLWHLQTFLVLFILAIVLSVLPAMASDYLFDIFKLFLSFLFWPLCCLSFHLWLLITSLTSSNFSCPFYFGHCVVCPSIYGFWLLFKLFLSFLFWPLCCMSFFHLWLLITSDIFKLFLSFLFWPLCCLSFHPSMASDYGFSLWHLQTFLVCPSIFILAIVLSVLPSMASDYLWHLQTFLVLFILAIVLSILPSMASDYLFDIFKLFLSFFFWPLCCLSFPSMASDYLFDIFKLFLSFLFWPLCCLSFFHLWLLITSDIFKLFLSFLFWPLCCLSFHLWLLITSLTSSNFSCPFYFGHSVVCPSIYGFWLPLWHLQTFLVLFILAIVLSVLLPSMASDYLWPLWYLQTFLVLFILAIVLSVLPSMASDYLWHLQTFLDIFKLFLSFLFWPLCCLSFHLWLLITSLTSSNFSCPFYFGHCVVCPSSIYGFWLPLWHLQTFDILSFLFWPLCCLSFHLWLLITSLTSSNFVCPFYFGHCVVCPSIYGFWLPLWYLQTFLVLFILAIVLSVLPSMASDYLWHLQTFLVLFILAIVLSILPSMASDYLFDIFKLCLSFFCWPLCCLSFFHLWLLITSLTSSNFSCPFYFGHCVVCPSIYGFWLPLWHLQTFLVIFILANVLSILPSMASDYLFDIFKLFLSFLFWPLCCLSFFQLWLLITSLTSSNFSCPFYFGHCVVCPSIYGFWLPLWHLQTFLVLFILAIVLSVLPSMASDYLFDIFKLFLSFLFWPLCCLSFFHLWLLITSLTSSNFSCPFYFGHCVVCPSIYGFWLPLTSSNFSCPFYFGHCVVYPSIYGFWLPLWHLQTFLVLFILAIVCMSFFHYGFWLPLTSSNFSCPFYFGHCVVCPSIYGFWLPLWHLQTFLVLFILAIVLSVLLYGFWLPLASNFSCPFYFGHCIVCPSIYDFWLPLIFKLFLSFLFWPLCCLSFHLWLLITSLISSNFVCPFSVGHCVVYPSSIYGFWLPLWHLQTFLVLFILAIVLSVLLPAMASDYLFDIFKLFLSFLFSPLCCLSFHLWLLITSLTSSNFSCHFYFGHCVVCPSSSYGFWLPLWHLQTFLVLFIFAIVLSVLPSMASDYLFDIFKLFLSFLFWPLCCLSVFHLWLLIISLVSSIFSCPFYFGHCVVCPSSIYGFWLPLTSSNFSCPFYFGHCVVCPSSIYGFWLPLWHLQTFLVLFILVIVLSVLLPSMASDYLWHLQTFLVLFILAIVLSVLPSMASDYLFDIFKLFLSFLFWPLCCLSFHLWLLITSLTSSNFSCPFYFGHCVVCPSSIYGFWLPLWYLQTFLVLFILAIVLSVLPSMASDYLFDIFKLFLSFLFWPLCCLSFHLWLLITSLTSSNFSCPFYFGHCVVCPSSIYGFWLPLWYLQTFLVLFILAIVLSVLPSMASDYLCLQTFLVLFILAIYGFWLPLWHLQTFLVIFILANVLSILPSMASDYLFDIFKLCLSFFCWPLCCLSFFHLWLLITSLTSSNFSCPFYFGHCVVCPSIYGFWLPLWHLQTFLVIFILAIMLSILLPSMASDYLFDIFKLFLSFFCWPLCCLSFFHLWLLITSLTSSNFSCPFYFGHCVVCPSIYGFWLPLWHLQTFLVLFILAIVLSVLPSMASDYLFDIFKLFLSFLFWPLCYLSFFHLWLLITLLVSSNFSCPFYFGHCVVCPSSIYDFWLLLWLLQTFLVIFNLAIVLSVFPSMASDYLFGIFKPFLSFLFWPLCCLSFFYLWLLITSLLSSNFSYRFTLEGTWTAYPSGTHDLTPGF